MPIYHYHCSSCGHEYDLRQGFDASTQDVCPRCQATSQRRFHSVAVIYKGSGFYTTDYKHKSFSEAGNSRNGEEKASPEDHHDDHSVPKEPATPGA